MSAKSPLRAPLWLGLIAVAGAGGWAGGRAAREGLYPDNRTARHSPSPPPQAAGPREPRVEDLAALPAGDQAIALAERKQAPAKLQVIRQP